MIGLICGSINGMIVAKGKVAPIICTMGFMYIWRGMAYVISNNAWASGQDVAGFSDFGKDGAIGPYIILIIAYIIFFVVMKWTKFGRQIYAVGSNKEAAAISGINGKKTITSVYAIMGMLVVYCLKDVTPLQYPYGLPELIASAAVVLSYIARRNTVLSILAGTILYMVLTNFVF